MIYLAWLEGPEGFRELMAIQYFIDSIKDQDIQINLKLGGI